jgi:eukaryotic-like serine/threonine-protein kinase
VSNYNGLREILAVQKIREAGLTPNVIRQHNADIVETYVFRQSPTAGAQTNKGNEVTIYVSQGPPQVTVPDVTGRSVEDAVQRLADANLRAQIVRVDSNEDQGTVVGQEPTDGATLDEGATVKLKVSKGPQPLAVPTVIGESFASANSKLQAAGFAVARHNVDSTSPADVVVNQSPGPGTFQPPGTTVTLDVSKGPTTSAVPDVTSQDQASAQSQLRSSGFRVRIETQDTNDPSTDGIVLSQDPAGGTQAPKGTTVTIVVGKFTETPAPPP